MAVHILFRHFPYNCVTVKIHVVSIAPLLFGIQNDSQVEIGPTQDSHLSDAEGGCSFKGFSRCPDEFT